MTTNNLSDITTIVLDLNGTLSVHGKIVDGALERLHKLISAGYTIVVYTGDQRGTAASLLEEIGIRFHHATTSADKEKLFLTLDTEKTAAIGNARIDIGTFKHAALSIATLQAEGIHTAIIEHVDIIIPSINDALDLFLDSDALYATMRE